MTVSLRPAQVDTSIANCPDYGDYARTAVSGTSDKPDTTTHSVPLDHGDRLNPTPLKASQLDIQG